MLPRGLSVCYLSLSGHVLLLGSEPRLMSVENRKTTMSKRHRCFLFKSTFSLKTVIKFAFKTYIEKYGTYLQISCTVRSFKLGPKGTMLANATNCTKPTFARQLSFFVASNLIHFSIVLIFAFLCDYCFRKE